MEKRIINKVAVNILKAITEYVLLVRITTNIHNNLIDKAIESLENMKK